MPNLKPSTKTISLRLPEGLLNSIKIEANKRDMPYPSLIKSWLANDVKQSRNAWWSANALLYGKLFYGETSACLIFILQF